MGFGGNPLMKSFAVSDNLGWKATPFSFSPFRTCPAHNVDGVFFSLQGDRMQMFVRNAAIAGLVALVLVLVLAGAAHSQNWNSTQDTGLTSVRSVLEGDTFVWTLTNNSSLAQDEYPDFDVLAWDMMPYQILEPESWSAPEGWAWDGKRMKLASNSDGYFTPHALGPGQSLTFTYQPKVGGEYINTSGPIDMVPRFAVHVAAVFPGSGTLDAVDRWEEYYAENLAETWHDRATIGGGYPGATLIPEASGLLVLGFLSVSLATLLMPCRRRPH